MRLFRRRGARPGRARPEAVYARAIDGDHLWLAVRDAVAPLVLRDLAGGGDIEVPTESDDGLLTCRHPLTEDAAGPATYAVLADGLPVHIAPLPDLSPVRIPRSRNGRWQLDCHRGDDGALLVTRTAVPPVSHLLDVGVDDGALVLRVGPADATGLLVMAADHVLTAIPLSDGHARIAADDVPLVPGSSAVLSVHCAEGRLPLHRARNDLAAPGRSGVLPGVADGTGRQLRLGFQPTGRVLLRRPTDRPEGT